MPALQPGAQYEGGRSGCFKAFIPSTLGVCAIIFGAAANFYCETVQFTQNPGNDGLVLYAGPFSYRTKDAFQWNNENYVYTTCRSYDYIKDSFGFRYTVDAKTKTVWSFAIMTVIFGGVFLVGACLAPCRTFGESRWKALGCLLISMSLFQGLTLMIESSSICTNNPVRQFMETQNADLAATFSDTCEWATGYALNITAVVLWFLAGLSCYILPAPVVHAEYPKQDQEVTYQQNADGTVSETNVVVQGKAAAKEEP